MTKTLITAAGFGLAAALIALPALAQPACLQNNRLLSTKVIDSQTILATDKDHKDFTVHMNGKCVGLDKFAELLSFRPKTDLGCLEAGDTVSYSLPGDPKEGARSITIHGAQGQLQCSVGSVTAGGPGTAG